MNENDLWLSTTKRFSFVLASQSARRYGSVGGFNAVEFE
jgi:hypothetical protein